MINYKKGLVTDGEGGRGFNEGLRIYMLKVYNYMSLALLITAISSFITLNFPPLIKLMYHINPDGRVYGVTGFGILIQIAPFMVALSFAFGLARMSVETAKTLFWIYAVLIGMSLSSLRILYTGQSLVLTFCICSSLFASMCLYGYTTNKDLTSLGSFLVMGLVGLILASLINIFMHGAAINFAISLVGVVVFMGLTAWDTQKLKEIYYYGGDESGQKIAIMGAFSLYLDFINLFLSLLNFFGEKKED